MPRISALMDYNLRMPVVMTHRDLLERQVAQDHVPSKSLTPFARRVQMGLPLYSCSCDQWASEDYEGFRAHFDAEVARRS